MIRGRKTVVAASLVALTALSACGGSDGGGGAAAQPGAYPVTVANCGAQVTLQQAPHRVVMLKSAAVPFLNDLGVLDRVTARAGAFPPGYYDQATQAKVNKIPSLTDKVDSSGHLQISKETVISQRPDLVLGEVENLSRASLAAVGIPLLEEPALCEKGVDKPTFESVYRQLTMYGEVFDRPEQARTSVAGLQKRVAAASKQVQGAPKRTAAVLYPTVGGGTTYAYGTKSMADPQLRAAGFTNVFGDVPKRVFETSPEQLLQRNPDVIIMLYSDGDPAKVADAVRTLPGAGQLKAVQQGNLMPQLFNFTEPPSPLSVTGLERIIKRFPS